MNEKAVDAREKARRELEASKPFPKKKPPPRPVLACVNGNIVADAVVIVSSSDPNWWRGMAVRRDGEIQVRR
jgi:hypothetical protein